jgi:hypothetical protein
MELKTHNAAIPVLEGRAMLRADYSPRDGATGEVTFQLEDQESSELTEITLRLDPWSPDGFEVYDWSDCNVLVVCSSRRVVSLAGEALRLSSAVGLEYEEGENLDRPWFLELRTVRLLVVATDRRVWCLDQHGTIRWFWSARYDASERWIFDAPKALGGALHVPVRTMAGDSMSVLSVVDGLEG